MQHAQPAGKYPLIARVIAWTIIVVGLALFGLMIFRIAKGGVTPAMIAGVAAAALAVWRNHRKAARRSVADPPRSPDRA
jgi:K+ transporter